MVSPISLDEIEKHAENVYEAIVIVAKRARQINDEQKRLLEMQLEAQEEMEDALEGEPSAEPVEQPYVRLPKPTRLALEEMLTGKLKFEYPKAEKPSDEEAESSEAAKE